MKKIKPNQETRPRASVVATPVVPLRESAVASASKLISRMESDGRAEHDAPAKSEIPAGNTLVACADSPEIAALKARSAAFGIDATTNELISAALLLLSQQTETALEVAILQSLRADRSFTKRRARR